MDLQCAAGVDLHIICRTAVHPHGACAVDVDPVRRTAAVDLQIPAGVNARRCQHAPFGNMKRGTINSHIIRNRDRRTALYFRIDQVFAERKSIQDRSRKKRQILRRTPRRNIHTPTGRCRQLFRRAGKHNFPPVNNCGICG